jgi:hypothetical protein
VAAQGLTVDGQRDLGDLRFGGVVVGFARELDHGVRLLVQQSFEAPHLAFGVLSHRLRDVDVLALDDRPHG